MSTERDTQRTSPWQPVIQELCRLLKPLEQHVIDFAENPGELASLSEIEPLLAQVEHTLDFIELYGGAMLTKEVRALVGDLVSGSIKSPADALDSLMRATIELPAYLERIECGAPDIPILLLPLLNDLRAARGSALLSEAILLVPDLSLPADFEGDEQGQLERVAQRVRPAFMRALLGWLRAEDSKDLKMLNRILRDLERHSGSTNVATFWRICCALTDALKGTRIDNTPAVKALLSQVERVIKLVLDHGEREFLNKLPANMLRNLLYYVGRAGSGSTAIDDIVARYRLDELIPSEHYFNNVAAAYRRPAPALLHAAHQAIVEDLGRVKDSLEVYTHSEHVDNSELVPAFSVLYKLCETLSVLGMGGKTGALKSQLRALEAQVDAGASHAVIAPELETLAEAMLRLEQSVENYIEAESHFEVLGEEDDEALNQALLVRLPRTEYLSLIQQIVSESCSVYARLKEAFSQYLNHARQAEMLEPVLPQLKEVKGVFQFLDLAVIESQVGSLIEILQQRYIEHRIAPDAQEQACLADLVASLEMALEALASGQPPQALSRFLTVGSSAVLALKAMPLSTSTAQEDATLSQSLEEDELDNTLESDYTDRLQVVGEPEGALLDTFIGEALESYAVICQLIPELHSTPWDIDRLIELRRTYHTLKGSGALVKAELLSEFSWSQENLLNQLLLHPHKDMGEAVLKVLEEGQGVLPQLIEQLKGTPEPVSHIDALIGRAHQLAALLRSDSNEASAQHADLTSDNTMIALDETSDESDFPAVDPVLRDIFVNECRGHIRAIRTSLKERLPSAKAWVPDDLLQRELHTLNGSAITAFPNSIALVSAPLEQLIALKRDLREPISEGELSLITRTLDAMETALEAILEGSDRADITQPTAQELMDLAHALSEGHNDTISDVAAEIRSTFLEEASEHLDALNHALSRWRADPAQSAPRVELKRRLHTLKGSANMAEFTTLASLAHKVETSVQQSEQFEGIPEESYFSLLQEIFDAVATNLEQASRGKSLMDFAWLGDELLAWQPGQTSSGGEDDAITELDAGPDVGVSPRDAMVFTPLDEEETSSASSAEASPQSSTAKPTMVSPEPSQRFEPPVISSGASLAQFEQSSGEVYDPLLEHVKIHVGTLDKLSKYSAENNVYRSRMRGRMDEMRTHLSEFDRTTRRLREQLRQMEQETEAQIRHGYRDSVATVVPDDEFDPLEMDRYSRLQELSRGLMESVSDFESLHGILHNLTRDGDGSLAQQDALGGALYDGLMRLRLLNFEQVLSRLQRIVRTAASQSGKQVNLTVHGQDVELDRSILNQLLTPLEHMLRNAVAHGIESPSARESADKSPVGCVEVTLQGDSGEIVLSIKDDGAGIDFDGVRERAIEDGLIENQGQWSQEDLQNLLLMSGFSTAREVDQLQGRGVGLDIVHQALKQLGGTLRILTERGRGTEFVIRVPQTLSINQALLVETAGDTYAIPVNLIRGVTHITVDELRQYYVDDQKFYRFEGEQYRVVHLAQMLRLGDGAPLESGDQTPLIFIRCGEQRVALHVDTLMGRREIAVKPGGEQLRNLAGIAGATIMGDGQVVLVLDMNGLLLEWEGRLSLVNLGDDTLQIDFEDQRPVAVVVDDSITIRKVTSRMLERHNFRVITAKDGVEALQLIKQRTPDVVLLDLEMPRMDGFELARHLRQELGLGNLPIVVITSRTGNKHRARAAELGIYHYLGKPYQETELISVLRNFVRIPERDAFHVD